MGVYESFTGSSHTDYRRSTAGVPRPQPKALCRRRSKVVICDLNREAGEAIAATLGPDAAFYEVNIADWQAVQDWVNDVVERYGRIDVCYARRCAA
ncbi:MAG: SDR family oxidoreductase [Chloroflexota bacterium]